MPESVPARGCAACGGCPARKAEAALTDAVDDARAAELLPELPEADAAAPELPERVRVVDVRFRPGGKVYYFDPGDLTLQPGDHVIIDTARGAEYGICAGGSHTVPAGDVVTPLREVVRIADEQDEKCAADRAQKEKRAYSVCLQKIREHKLEMQLVSAECAFDGSKIVFFFTAEGRVDFRELVKNLAAVFRTRIELRQIGVRDKARMVGGLGVCGRPFCCAEFLEDFQPVSIKMAKTQNLSLNPTKISGTCGRLMCCLKYEQAAYEELHKTAPKPESFVDTPDGRGTVTDVNLLRQTVRVRMEDRTDTIGTYRTSEIAVLRNGKARKTDPPIPPDLAPISGRSRGTRRREAPESPAERRQEESINALFRRMDEYAAKAPEPRPEEAEAAPAEEKTGRRRRRRRKSSGQRPAEGGEVRPEQKPEARPEQKPEARPPREPKAGRRAQSGQGQSGQNQSGQKAERRPQAEAAAPAGEQKPRRRRRRRSHGHGGASAPQSGAPDAQQ